MPHPAGMDPAGLQVRRAASAGDFGVVRSMLDEMGQWDVEETRRLGVPTDDVISTFYPEPAAELMETFSKDGNALFLCFANDAPVGCGGVLIADGVAEVCK